MTKQEQFQKDNFDKFNEADLSTDLESIIKFAEDLESKNETILISTEEDKSFGNPYGLMVEGDTYWYESKNERNEDKDMLEKLIAKYFGREQLFQC